MSTLPILLPAKPSIAERLRLRLERRRALRTIDRAALEAVRRRFSASDPAAGNSKYWRLERQLSKNLLRARRLSLHRPPAGLSVLDLGTGFGLFPFACRFYGHRAVGLDLDDEPGSLYREVNATLGTERVLGRIRPGEPLPVSGRRFDLVTGFAVLFNDPQDRPWGPDEWGFFVADVAERLLVPGGRLFLSLNRDRDGRYLDDDTVRLLCAAGAVVDRRDVYFPRLGAAPGEP